MKRSGKIIVVCHCLLNANAKVEPYARYGGINQNALHEYLSGDYGIIQLPCPETTYLGMKRWGMTKGQYETPAYIRHCRRIIQSSLNQIEASLNVGYTVECVMGVKGSPNCGVFHSCRGYHGGEIEMERIREQVERVNLSHEPGIFIEICREELDKRNIELIFQEIED